MILHGQRFFLLSVTVAAFLVGTATGSILTFSPGEEASLAGAPGSVQDLDPLASGRNGVMALTAEIEADVEGTDQQGYPQTADARAALQGSASPDANDQAITRNDADIAVQMVATSSDRVEASTQSDKTFPAALPQKKAVIAPTPGLASNTEVTDIATLAKGALKPRPWETKAIKARRGDSMTTILKRAGVEGQQVHAALRSLRGVYDPRNLRAGQELAVTAATRSDQPAHLLSVSLDLDFDHQILIMRDADGDFTTKKVEQAKRRELVHRGGDIETSLYLSARRHEIPNSVTERLIRMFSWDVDFQRDIHPGDRFETLYEEVTLEKDESQVKGQLIYAGLEVRGELLDAYLYSPDGGRPTYYDSKGRSLRKFLLRTPVDGARLSSHFGKRRHPVLGYTKMHKGTDFAAPRGTPIYAGGSGVVERSDRYGGYGNYLRIRHSNTYSTAYAHLSKFAKGIKPGIRVRQGQVVGYVGTTGRSTGPHLHYEVLKNGKQINPMKMKHPPATQLKDADLASFKKEVDRIDAQRAKLARERQLVSQSASN